MLRLPQFSLKRPTTIEEAVEALGAPGARVVAGGTDILPNLKHRLDSPETLVSLDRVAELKGIARSEDGASLRIGAGETLTDVSESAVVGEHFPSLAKAASLVASPLIRNMGTIGGNVNLDTRCRYVNQSHFWRGAIGGCLKSEGDVCHVVPGGRSCVAAMSSDCVPVLISLGASLHQIGASGSRQLPVAEYFSTDGISNTLRETAEITTAIEIPLPTGPRFANYAKWTVRKSIDFPLVSCAMRFELDSEREGATITEAHLCIGVLAARPKVLRAEALVGRSIAAAETAELLGEIVFKQSKPLPNVPYEPEYRRKMLPVFARRALGEWGR